MISFLISALKIIFVLGFLILIHEGGHFLIARLCKVKVNEFSIGFGPTILKKQGRVTKYSLRLIPLGGYVNLEGEETYSEEEGSFSTASIPKKMAIVVAGGLVNIVFGILVYFILMTCVGDNYSLVIDKIVPGFVAEEVNLQENDEILEINNNKLFVKSDFNKILDNSNGEELNIKIKRNDEIQQIVVIPTKKEYKTTGIYLKQTNNEKIKVLAIEKNSAADKQDIKVSDEIIGLNGIEVHTIKEITEILTNNEIDKISIKLKRNDEIIDIELIPDLNYKYYLGVEFKKAENNLLSNMYYAVFDTKDFAISIVDNLKMLFTGNVRINDMMGPVGISEAVATTKGAKEFVYLMALISLSLGITNLIPFPALDGGKFALLLLEAIRRKKLSEKIEINLQLIGFAILILLAIYVTYNDILRIM